MQLSIENKNLNFPFSAKKYGLDLRSRLKKDKNLNPNELFGEKVGKI